MIQLSAPILQGCEWKNLLAQAIRDPGELLQLLDLPPTMLPGAIAAAQSFPLRVPISYVQRMNKRDPDDPLLRQVLPLNAELDTANGYQHDPVGDIAAQTVPGLLHKYRGRALLVTTGACAIHCRYCFRRNFPYAESNPAQDQWRSALHYLNNNTDIHEIILSGGDPLSLSDHRLLQLIDALEKIQHLKTVRLHTRLPIVIPQRVNATLLQRLTNCSLRIVMVVHINHANEIDDEVSSAMIRIREAGITLFNQSVLLKGVNDSIETLATLSQRLFDNHILPYYLHQLDKVTGAAHFAVNDNKAIDLIGSLRELLPGYLVPRLVRELPGEPSKVPLL